jgi:hypothetical protein
VVVADTAVAMWVVVLHRGEVAHDQVVTVEPEVTAPV